MTKIIDEVRSISSDAISKKKDKAQNQLPLIIEEIKKAAALGKTECEFDEHRIDEYGKEFLTIEGFRVYAATKEQKYVDKWDYIGGYRPKETKTIWVVRW